VPWLVLVLRLLHIIGGVFWVGATFAFAFFVEPTAAALGPQGGAFVQRLTGRSGFSPAMTVAAFGSVLAGLALFWIDSGGLQRDWMAGGTGVTLSIGAACGLAGAVVGFVIQKRNADRMGALARAMRQQAGGPTPEQLAAVRRLQGKLRTGGRASAVLLAAAVVCMAAARYMAF